MVESSNYNKVFTTVNSTTNNEIIDNNFIILDTSDACLGFNVDNPIYALDICGSIRIKNGTLKLINSNIKDNIAKTSYIKNKTIKFNNGLISDIA